MFLPRTTHTAGSIGWGKMAFPPALSPQDLWLLHRHAKRAKRVSLIRRFVRMLARGGRGSH